MHSMSISVESMSKAISLKLPNVSGAWTPGHAALVQAAEAEPEPEPVAEGTPGLAAVTAVSIDTISYTASGAVQLGGRGQPGGGVDQRDLRAEPVVDFRDLDADGPGPDDDQAVRSLGEVEHRGYAEHGLAVDRGRIARMAISLAVADLAERGANSDLVRGLGQP